LCFSAFSVFSVLWLAARRTICGQRPGAMGQRPGARGPGGGGACLSSVFGFCFSLQGGFVCLCFLLFIDAMGV
jgi:hypothetical protein